MWANWRLLGGSRERFWEHLANDNVRLPGTKYDTLFLLHPYSPNRYHFPLHMSKYSWYFDWIQGECPDVWSCSVWIGAGRNDGWIFVWSRYGNQLTFQPWYPGEPRNRTCVHLLQTGHWDDDFCNIPKMYICEKEVSLE